MREVTITVSGPVGCGKSAILGEIEILCKALGVPCRYADEAAAQAEKNGTHADWTSALEMYKPSVVLVESIVHDHDPDSDVSGTTSGTNMPCTPISFVSAQPTIDERIADLAKTLRIRGKALQEGGEDWMETLGEHYALIADEVDELTTYYKLDKKQ